MTRSLLIAVALLGVTGCSSSTAPDLRWAVPQHINYAPELGVDLSQMERTASGLYIQDLEIGTGQAAVPGKTVAVHYSGWLPDGTLFDSRLDKTLSFMLGVGFVIRGWDEGLVGMRAGGRRRLVVPPELGYGRSGSPPVIPPLATLVFEVHMVSITP